MSNADGQRPRATSPLPTVDLIGAVKEVVGGLVTDFSRRMPHVRYADVRLEVVQAKTASAENGTPKGAGEDYSFGLGTRVLAGDRMVAAGYFGRALGASDVDGLEAAVGDALDHAYRRALASPAMKAGRL
jgi:hypothetical protein